MKKAKLVISEELSSILDKFYLTYPPTESLGEDDIKFLFHQIYRRGYEDAMNRVDYVIRNVRNNMDAKL